MSKQFNNSAGTTSSEFSIGAGHNNVRHIVIGTVCRGSDSNAVDREGNEILVDGVEFFDLKMLATDQAGGIATKQMRGTVALGSAVHSVEEVFQEASGADVILSLIGNTFSVKCLHGTSPLITYSIYISLLKAS